MTASKTDAEPTRRGRGRPRDPATDRRITEAAAELMLERGFDKMTVDDVAAKAGVGKATVYRRWPSKEDLAVAAMETLFSAEVPEADTGSLEGDLRENYARILTFANSDRGAAFVRMAIAESVRDPRIAALYAESNRRREDLSRRTFMRAVERGEVSPNVDVDVAVQWLAAIITMRSILRQPMPSVDDLDMLLEATLKGLRP